MTVSSTEDYDKYVTIALPQQTPDVDVVRSAANGRDDRGNLGVKRYPPRGNGNHLWHGIACPAIGPRHTQG